MVKQRAAKANLQGDSEQSVAPTNEGSLANETQRKVVQFGNTPRSSSQLDHIPVAELHANVSSPFPLKNSPAESTMSQNSHNNYPFSYNHEASDFKTPRRSPPSLNLQPTKVQAVRVRRNLGIYANSSALQPHKDMSKGYIHMQI